MKVRRLVIDTNVLISAIVFGGKSRQVLESVISGESILIISETLMEELEGVLRGPKFRYPPEMMRMILGEIVALAEIVEPDENVHVITTDPDDNRVLECAISGRADVIVSGDSDLLDLQEFQGIRILTPAQFVHEILLPE